MTPNHALQRTAPGVTAPASTAAFPPTMQVPRRPPQSLSLRSFAEPMMRSSVISILIGQLLALSGFAVTDATPHPSPDGKFLIANVGDTAEPAHHFELRRSDGFVLFSFKGSPGFDLPSFAEDISWSDRGEFVALSVSTGKYLQDTLIIATASGKAIKVQTDDSDYQTRPIRWTRRGELIVETKAPYGGKADDDLSWARYQYRRTLRIRGGGSRVERVYTGPTVYPYRAELLRDGYKPRHGPTANRRSTEEPRAARSFRVEILPARGSR